MTVVSLGDFDTAMFTNLWEMRLYPASAAAEADPEVCNRLMWNDPLNPSIRVFTCDTEVIDHAMANSEDSRYFLMIPWRDVATASNARWNFVSIERGEFRISSAQPITDFHDMIEYINNNIPVEQLPQTFHCPKDE